MLGNTSSSQPTVGFGGSGALSHTYIHYPPLRCKNDGSRGLFYDDGNKLLISSISDKVVSWKTSPFTPHVAPTTDAISEGPVLSVRYSLDAKLIAVQRSNHEVQFWIRETGDTFSQKCRSESDSILGVFWTDCAVCDIVFVKTSGLDLYTYVPELKSLDLVETKKMNVSWYIYTHESRLVLLSSGMQCKSFTGYQLSSAGVIRLPRFEMVMAKSDVNSKPVLAAEDVHIVTVYGRIYCLQVDRVAMLLHSYRFYRDAVIQQGSLPVYSSKIAVSVVDNVLLVHQVDAKVVILYDIFADSRTPVSAPLPLLIRGLPRTSISSSQSSRKDAESSEATLLNDTASHLYGDDWNFLVPDLVCDVATGFLWKIHLDLEAISASSSEVPSVLEFLQRRKLEAKKVIISVLTVGCPREPWHDLHSRIEGPAAYDVLRNFEERWLRASKPQEISKLKKSSDDSLLKLDRIPDIVGIDDAHCTSEQDPEGWHVQVFRSIDSNSVKGFPKDPKDATSKNLVCGKNVLIDMSIHTAYVKAIRAAQHFIYIENQYFLGSSFNWSNHKTLNANNLIPMEIALKIANKIRAKERFAAYIVIAMWPEGSPTSTATQRILY